MKLGDRPSPRDDHRPLEELDFSKPDEDLEAANSWRDLTYRFTEFRPEKSVNYESKFYEPYSTVNVGTEEIKKALELDLTKNEFDIKGIKL